MSPRWAEDCEAQQELEKLFEMREISVNDMPAKIQAKYATFQPFSAAVFRKNFNKTKKHFFSVNANVQKPGIPELDGAEGMPAKKLKIDDEIYVPETVFKTAPIHKFVYKNPATKKEKVAVAVLLFGGVELEVEFDVLKRGDHQILHITYLWPDVFLNPVDLWNIEGALDYHPLYSAMEDSLEAQRYNTTDTPTGTIEVKLPKEVQYIPANWEKEYKKHPSGCSILLFKFDCVDTLYVTKKSDFIVKIKQEPDTAQGTSKDPKA